MFYMMSVCFSEHMGNEVYDTTKPESEQHWPVPGV